MRDLLYEAAPIVVILIGIALTLAILGVITHSTPKPTNLYGQPVG